MYVFTHNNKCFFSTWMSIRLNDLTRIRVCVFPRDELNPQWQNKLQEHTYQSDFLWIKFSRSCETSFKRKADRGAVYALVYRPNSSNPGSSSDLTEILKWRRKNPPYLFWLSHLSLGRILRIKPPYRFCNSCRSLSSEDSLRFGNLRKNPP